MFIRYKCFKNNNLIQINELYNNFNEIAIKGIDNSCIDLSIKNILNVNKNIIDYSISKNISSYYPVVLLTQCYNEEKNIKDYLNNVSRFVDAIIVLDDGSDDNSWELLKLNKIIIKIKIKRTTFDDLRNRNLLLNVFENALLKNKINVDWFLWLDFDERITDNQKFLSRMKQNILSSEFKSDNVSLPLFHMWNNTHYNSEYPHSKNGCQYKLRLIRNNMKKLPYVLKNRNKLHFLLSPYEGTQTFIPLQIKHLSYIDKKSRIKKYNLYTKFYDTQKIQKSYEHFLNDDVKLLPYDDLLIYKKLKDKE